jgi:hypothetical protein
MARKSPINVKELTKRGLTSRVRFFRLLSEQNNYVDPEVVEKFYMGLVRLITQELRTNGFIRLPHLGDFAMLKQKDRVCWAGKFKRLVTGKYLLKFFVSEKWRDYFTALEEKTGLEGKLDPREKVLGYILDEYGVEE